METLYIRKLIDIKPAVFESLTVMAKGQNMSLKKYIETLLEKESSQRLSSIPPTLTDLRVINLLGLAKRAVKDLDSDDDRAQYILSK